MASVPRARGPKSWRIIPARRLATTALCRGPPAPPPRPRGFARFAPQEAPLAPRGRGEEGVTGQLGLSLAAATPYPLPTSRPLPCLQPECAVLGLVLLLVVLGLSLAVLLWAGTLWFQGYIYSEPVAQIYWRAPAAALALTLFMAVWCFLDYRSPGDYPGQIQFSTGDEKTLPELWALRQG